MGRGLRLTAAQYHECWGDSLAANEQSLIDKLEQNGVLAAAPTLSLAPAPARPPSTAGSDASSVRSARSASVLSGSVRSGMSEGRTRERIDQLQQKLAAEQALRSTLEEELQHVQNPSIAAHPI